LVQLMRFVIPVGLVLTVAVLLYALVMFDRLVRAEYEGAREAWEADGRPRGFFWKAPECTWYRSAWALNRLSFVWLFATPAWVARSTTSRNWLRHWRVSVLTWNVIILTWLILAAWVLA
jgi:hypothetical protein